MVPSCGIQKTFHTVAEVRERCSGTPVGTLSLFARDSELGIDEEPLPIHQHHLDVKGGIRGKQGLSRVEIVRADPGDAAEEDDG